MVGVDAEAAGRKLGAPPTFGQSPFAFSAGDRFEEGLRRDHYARWLTALREQLGFPSTAVGVADLDAEFPWPHPRSADFVTRQRAVAAARLARTDALLSDIIEGRDAPVLILHARLRLAVTDTVREVEPDALLVWPGSQMVRVGEVKSYVDHGHRTDKSDLAKTRQQIAVYVLALEQTCERLGAGSDHGTLYGPWPGEEGVGVGDLVAATVLRRPQSMQPSVGLEFVERDVELVRRGLARTPATLREILALLPSDATLDDADVLRELPTRYEPAWCLGNCPLAAACREEARKNALPCTFGGETPSVLAAIPDLRRAHSVATDPGAAVTDAEQPLADRIRLVRARIDEGRRAC